MKNVGLYIAIVTISALVVVVGAANTAERPPTCGQAPAQDELTAPAPRNLAFPSFCDIPPAPKSVPSAVAFKSEVVGVRVAGRDLDQQSGPDTWSLSETEGFAGTARRDVEPPPPMSPSNPSSTEAFAKESQSLATPPPRPHHRHHH